MHNLLQIVVYHLGGDEISGKTNVYWLQTLCFVRIMTRVRPHGFDLGVCVLWSAPKKGCAQKMRNARKVVYKESSVAAVKYVNVIN